MADPIKPLKPDFWAVALDVTANYRIEPEDAPYIKAIKDVFQYDQTTRTHCCEATPSYFLEHLYTTVEYNENNRPPNGVDDRIDQTYCYCPTEACYMHCSTVKAIKEQVQYDPTGALEQDEAGEIPREYWQGNYPF